MSYSCSRVVCARFGLAAITVALSLAAVAPAAAEFFGCNDRPGQLLYSSRSSSGGQYRSASRYTHEFAVQSAHRRVRQSHAAYYGSRRYGNDRSRW